MTRTACAHSANACLDHPIKSTEMPGAMLLTERNLWFYQALMAAMRAAIAEGRFAGWAGEFGRGYGGDGK